MGAWWLRGGWRVGGWVAWRAHFFYLLLAGLTLGSWELGSLFAQGVVIAGRFGNPYRGMLSGSRCRGMLAGSRAHSPHKAPSSPAASAAGIAPGGGSGGQKPNTPAGKRSRPSHLLNIMAPYTKLLSKT